jgi:hypothetical protein
MSDAKQPAAKINVHPVSVAIWANKTGKAVYYSATIASRYKDADGKWRNSVSLNENELLLAAKALDLAHSEILRLRSADRHADQPEEGAA